MSTFYLPAPVIRAELGQIEAGGALRHSSWPRGSECLVLSVGVYGVSLMDTSGTPRHLRWDSLVGYEYRPRGLDQFCVIELKEPKSG